MSDDWHRIRRKIARETRAALVERFPNCFVPKWAAKRPLKISIRRDLFAACPDIERDHIRIALDDYTNGPKYLGSVVTGAARVALDGSEAGTVTEIQAKHAALRLAGVMRRYAAAVAKREREQAREAA